MMPAGTCATVTVFAACLRSVLWKQYERRSSIDRHSTAHNKAFPSPARRTEACAVAGAPASNAASCGMLACAAQAVAARVQGVQGSDLHPLEGCFAGSSRQPQVVQIL